jgi:hypothetical protein
MILRRHFVPRGIFFLKLSYMLLASGAVGADGLAIRAKVRPDSNLDLSWYTLLGHTYRVEFKTDLNTSNWFSLPGDVIGICGDGFNGPRLLLVTNYPQRFFRVLDITSTNSPPLGFQGPDGKWRMYYEFSIGLNASYTNQILITPDGFALQDGNVFDGQFNGDAMADHFVILSNLWADERVEFAYPVYTDSAFSTRLRISNVLIIKPFNPAENLDQLFAAEHLGNPQYLPRFGLVFVTLLRKEDDPFAIVQRLESDPRIEYAEVSVFGDPRIFPCP